MTLTLLESVKISLMQGVILQVSHLRQMAAKSLQTSSKLDSIWLSLSLRWRKILSTLTMRMCLRFTKSQYRTTNPVWCKVPCHQTTTLQAHTNNNHQANNLPVSNNHTNSVRACHLVYPTHNTLLMTPYKSSKPSSSNNRPRATPLRSSNNTSHRPPHPPKTDGSTTTSTTLTTLRPIRHPWATTTPQNPQNPYPPITRPHPTPKSTTFTTTNVSTPPWQIKKTTQGLWSLYTRWNRGTCHHHQQRRSAGVNAVQGGSVKWVNRMLIRWISLCKVSFRSIRRWGSGESDRWEIYGDCWE